jgi:aspartokinase/homoserine dehydrogenase 1
MVVMKFGGTSLGSVDRIKGAARVVASSRQSDPIVILSAMGGVTDRLLDAGDMAIRGADQEVVESLKSLRRTHQSAVAGLIEDAGAAEALVSELEPIWEEMQKVLTGVLLLRELSTRSRDLIGSFGERLIVPIFSAYLNQIGVRAEAVDARKIILTKDDADFALVDFQETKRRCSELVEMVGRGMVPVVTGFICATPEGITTTLGRGGSDYTASVVGFSVDASEIQIWTDVDGVMTADPRIVSTARVLHRISYKEAAEMSYFGAKVLHPKTIMPAADLNIPIHIKNTFDPDQEGTLITTESPKIHQGVKTVSSITGVTLVSIEGRGMLGVPGTAQRAFGAIASRRINVLMFSQGSSEQHISLVVSKQDGDNTVRALRREFEPEIDKRQVDRIATISNIAIIALVGEGMKSIPGIAARTFGVIGDTDMNILMIAQGSSELNLSLVVSQSDASNAVRLIHDAFELGDV